ncbi:L,D-transpeptidase family protein [Streptomyces sp. SID3212]|nr:L,D-transpeptidase family protein [Streptomyces sp. SID3212]MYV56355.1 L,D-transpeptidase family protein [Streptomyces sp. SID3212]
MRRPSPASCTRARTRSRSRSARGRSCPAFLVAALLLTGCAATDSDRGDADSRGKGPVEAVAVGGPPGQRAAAEHRGAEVLRTDVPAEIPGLGPKTRAALPEDSNQAVVAIGRSRDSNRSTVLVYERDPVAGWQVVSGPWPAHNGLRGWTDDHDAGDRRSPIGVFGLTDAGGELRDPGSRLPYDRSSDYAISGTGFEDEPLEGSFDYVVAINYNRRPGHTPRHLGRPLGEEKGGGIWIHVDHGGPTQGCVSLARPRMKELLRTLDPGKRPVVVMGDKASLAR